MFHGLTQASALISSLSLGTSALGPQPWDLSIKPMLWGPRIDAPRQLFSMACPLWQHSSIIALLTNRPLTLVQRATTLHLTTHCEQSVRYRTDHH